MAAIHQVILSYRLNRTHIPSDSGLPLSSFNMKTPSSINSTQYWDSRFSNDWGTFDGPKQSRFFAQVAIDNLPDWILAQIRANSLTVADWGCAEGDGTDVWASFIDANQLTGIDFSAVAIDTAKVRYPSIRFDSVDWLSAEKSNLDSFDIVFSSNTLEHFHRPYDIVNALCQRAKKALILALPYREIDRIDEHFFSFLPDNIPLILPNGFRLIWSRVKDCRAMPDSHWNGEQIFLIFADPNWSSDLVQNLKNCDIHQDDLDTRIQLLMTSQKENEDQIKQYERSAIEQQSLLEKTQLQLENYQQQIIKSQEDHLQQTESQQERNQNLREQHNFLQQQHHSLEEKHNVLQVLRNSLQEQHNILCKLHAKERHTILKPILRLCYRSALEVFKKLPRPIKIQLRQLARHLPILKPQLPAHESQPLGLDNRDSKSNIDPWLDRILKAKSELSDIIVFPVIDWHFRVQRPQHLARGLANLGHRVFYLTTTFKLTDSSGFQVLESPAKNVFIVKLIIPISPPNIYTTLMTDRTANHIQDAGEQMYQAFNVGPAAALVDLPFWRKVTDHLPATIQIYDCMDHHAGFSTNEGDVQQKEELALLQSADVVISSSARLQEKLSVHSDSILIRNAAEIDFFKQLPES